MDKRIIDINGTSRMPYNDEWKVAPGSIPGRIKGSNPRKSRGQRVTKDVVRQMIASKLDATDEKKWALNAINTGVDNTGSITGLTTSITQGLSDTNNRVGDQITLDRMRLSYAIANGDTTNICRVVIFKWMPQSTPVLANILTGASGSTVIIAAHNTDTHEMYQILYDKTHFLSANSNALDGCGACEIKLPGQVQFSGGSTTGTGHIYCLLLSDSGGVPNPPFLVEATVYYYDA